MFPDFLTVLQEPGVYMVFVTAILQDASLSVKIASNLMEREVGGALLITTDTESYSKLMHDDRLSLDN